MTVNYKQSNFLGSFRIFYFSLSVVNKLSADNILKHVSDIFQKERSLRDSCWWSTQKICMKCQAFLLVKPNNILLLYAEFAICVQITKISVLRES